MDESRSLSSAGRSYGPIEHGAWCRTELFDQARVRGVRLSYWSKMSTVLRVGLMNQALCVVSDCY
jgi:hypothetical protein